MVRVQRVVGEVTGAQPGPLLLLVGGIHGNEPAGLTAALRVFQKLEAPAPNGGGLRGRLVALAGNLAALDRGERYLDRDLNRIWTDAETPDARAGPREIDERRDLLRAIRAELGRAPERAVLLDMHSTSAEGAPFCIMGDTLRNRVIARRLGVPVLLGLEEAVEGTLLEYFGELGHAALCLEGGQHERPSTVDHHEAAVWITLVGLGMLAREDVPCYDEHRRRLRRAGSGLPTTVEIRHRHRIQRGESFRMEPGFKNFQPVGEGRVLAWSSLAGGGEVRAPFRGLLLMPRYQGQGEDGFFLGREVRRPWLALSAFLRRLRAERLLPLLPGIRRHPTRAEALVADRRVARFLTVEVFHLFGFRRCSAEGGALVFARRVEGSR